MDPSHLASDHTHSHPGAQELSPDLLKWDFSSYPIQLARNLGLSLNPLIGSPTGS
jgi:hypothetical protein